MSRKRTNQETARPFLKWAGGKGQLIPDITKRLPSDFLENIRTYVEPFAGSGALLFRILQNHPKLDTAVVNDLNTDLINTYKAIKYSPDNLLEQLKQLSDEYFRLSDERRRKEMFLNIRTLFNRRNPDTVKQSAFLIFLNKTCFNGLYRVNSRNEFNVPFGRYKKPGIYDPQNLRALHRLLQKVEILNCDFAETAKYAGEKTFYYFDPPYRPISQTASFNSYANGGFNDDEQKRLKSFCDLLTAKKSTWLLSNSDPKNIDPNDSFFDNLYREYHIFRVRAKRSINSRADKRGKISELLITNYNH